MQPLIKMCLKGPKVSLAFEDNIITDITLVNNVQFFPDGICQLDILCHSA